MGKMTTAKWGEKLHIASPQLAPDEIAQPESWFAHGFAGIEACHARIAHNALNVVPPETVPESIACVVLSEIAAAQNFVNQQPSAALVGRHNHVPGFKTKHLLKHPHDRPRKLIYA